MTTPNEQETSIPAQLLREALAQAHGDHVLVYGAREPVLAVLVQQFQHVEVHDTSLIRLIQAQTALADAQLGFRQGIVLPADQHGLFNTVVIHAPQSRALARRWLVEAHLALCEGGTLFLGGMNDGGIRALIDDAAALFGGAHTLVSKRRGRVARAFKQYVGAMPLWASEPGIAPGTWHDFTVALSGETFRFESVPGVFSYDRLDDATQLLLEHVGNVRGKQVLDIGCGYGAIGVVLSQRGAASVDMLDENLYAVAAAGRNAETHGLAHARVAAADVRAAPFQGQYDLVVTNPPFHRGKQTDYDTPNTFIAYAHKVLSPNGRFLLVANSFLRYDGTMRHYFGKVEPIAQTPSFIVWQAMNGVK